MGKWLLDVAKYIVTVLFLSTLIADIDNVIIAVFVTIAFFGCLGMGLYLLRDSGKKKKNKRKEKK